MQDLLSILPPSRRKAETNDLISCRLMASQSLIKGFHLYAYPAGKHFCTASPGAASASIGQTLRCTTGSPLRPLTRHSRIDALSLALLVSLPFLAPQRRGTMGGSEHMLFHLQDNLCGQAIIEHRRAPNQKTSLLYHRPERDATGKTDSCMLPWHYRKAPTAAAGEPSVRYILLGSPQVKPLATTPSMTSASTLALVLLTACSR